MAISAVMVPLEGTQPKQKHNTSNQFWIKVSFIPAPLIIFEKGLVNFKFSNEFDPAKFVRNMPAVNATPASARIANVGMHVIDSLGQWLHALHQFVPVLHTLISRDLINDTIWRAKFGGVYKISLWKLEPKSSVRNTIHSLANNIQQTLQWIAHLGRIIRIQTLEETRTRIKGKSPSFSIIHLLAVDRIAMGRSAGCIVRFQYGDGIAVVREEGSCWEASNAGSYY